MAGNKNTKVTFAEQWEAHLAERNVSFAKAEEYFGDYAASLRFAVVTKDGKVLDDRVTAHEYGDLNFNGTYLTLYLDTYEVHMRDSDSPASLEHVKRFLDRARGEREADVEPVPMSLTGFVL